jgi:hypothetical protein
VDRGAIQKKRQNIFVFRDGAVKKKKKKEKKQTATAKHKTTQKKTFGDQNTHASGTENVTKTLELKLRLFEVCNKYIT